MSEAAIIARLDGSEMLRRYLHAYCQTCFWTTGGHGHKFCAYGHGPLAPIEMVYLAELDLDSLLEGV